MAHILPCGPGIETLHADFGKPRSVLLNWLPLAFLAYDGDHFLGTVVCKMEVNRGQMLRGYLAMLVVEKPYRFLGAGAICAHQPQEQSHGLLAQTVAAAQLLFLTSPLLP